MHGTVVAVLRGGPSREHEISLKTGHAIVSNLPREQYTVRDIYIDKQGVWHEKGRPIAPERALLSTDAVVIGLHGEYGEDGGVQKLLDKYGVPYTGSDSFSSYVAMHKVMSKEKAKEAGLLTPKYKYLEEGSEIETIAAEVVRTFSQPVVVKPVKWGSSVGVSIVSGYAPLVEAIETLMQDGAGGVLVEELIRGTEASAGVIEDFRGEELYSLPVLEIVPPASQAFFTYDAKYSGQSREMVPGNFSRTIADQIMQQARTVHQALGLSDYSRSDFIVSPKGIYYLETNSLPALTPESLFGKSVAAVGIHFSDFLEHLVNRAKS